MADQALREAAKRVGIDKSASVGEVLNAMLDRIEGVTAAESAANETRRGGRTKKDNDS